MAPESDDSFAGVVRRLTIQGLPFVLLFVGEVFCQSAAANPQGRAGHAGPPVKVFRVGNDLQEDCSGANSSSFAAHADGTVEIPEKYEGCFEYILGVSDAIQMNSTGVVCLPTGVIASNVVLVVTKYIDAHPEELHKAAVYIVRKALQSAFPCSRSK